MTIGTENGQNLPEDVSKKPILSLEQTIAEFGAFWVNSGLQGLIDAIRFRDQNHRCKTTGSVQNDTKIK